ncbi:hypothetical protein AB0L70_23720 [Kribbella sp. NPDC051952]|uniref:hypothetical protein n=1 Tax=Kribbella sp. NPDC051952 TaxID=3154851 RepID=UPI00342331F6
MADRFDLDAIDADDALLDLLAAGGESARAAGEQDSAVKLLADLRLAVEVEDQLPVETIDDPESFLARCASLNPITDPFARKMATRGLALGVAAVAALSVSGVAAAVNGDPLSPYEKVIEKMVDAVRPQTSFPKEQLDGMPVVDRSKIVKVAKNYKEVQDKKAAEEETRVKSDPIPPAAVVKPLDQQDVLQRALPKLPEQPTATLIEPTVPVPTKLPEKTDEKTTADDPVTTDPTTTDPSTTPTEPPASTPTEPPATTPTDPATTPTDPATTPTDPPTSPNNTETGTGNPTSAPTTGDGETGGDGKDETGTTTPPADTSPAETNPADTNPADTNPADTDPTGSDTDPADSDQKPGDGTSPSAPADSLTDVVDKILAPVLPTPTGAPVELQSAEKFFGEGVSTTAKHASGKVSTGSVKKAYPKGKHAARTYAEGKHAAIARAHGSTEDADVLKILKVVNKPTR